LIGRRWRVPVGVVLGVNSALGANRVFALVTVVAIAASTALATSLEMSSRAVQRLADRTAAALAGDAPLEVTAGELGVPERLIEAIAHAPGVASAAGALSATLTVDAARVPVHVLGIDLLAEGAAGELAAHRRGVDVRDPLKVVARGDAVLLSAGLAAQAGVGFDDALAVHGPLGARTLHVEGLLADAGVARAYAGQIAVMDVYALQALLGRAGFVDRIEVVPAPGVSLDALEAELGRVAAGTATVERPGRHFDALGQTVAGLRAAVFMLAGLGSAVAALLSYAALSTAVERRLREFAVLRATGFAARDVAVLILGDALAYAAVGTALGLAAGRVLAGRFVPAMTAIADFFVGSAAIAAEISVSPGTVALAAAVGFASALAGAVGPARAATRRWLADAAPEAPRAAAAPTRLPGPLVLAAALGACALLRGIPPRVRAPAELAIGAALAASLVRPALDFAARRRAGLSRALPGVGHLLGTGLAARPRGTALAVAAISCLVAFVLGALVLSASFGATLAAFVGARYPGGVEVTANAPLEPELGQRIAPAVVATIRAAPGVTDVCERYLAHALFRGEEVALSAYQAEASLRHRVFAPGHEGERDTLAALARGEVAVSETFARRYDVARGDELELPTPSGAVRFRVAGTFPNLAGPMGVVYLDLAAFDAHWPRTGASSLLFFTAGDPAPVIAAVRRATADAAGLFFTDQAALLEQARAFAGNFDALLFGVGSLALCLGGVAIANLLLGIAAARRRELVLLRTAGAAPNQLAALVLADAALLACGSIAIGGVLGALVASPLLEIMADEFGLILDTHFDWARLALLAALVLAAVLASAAYPAALVRRIAALEISSFA